MNLMASLYGGLISQYMLGRRREINLQLQQIVDMALVVLAFLLAYGFRVGILPGIVGALPESLVPSFLANLPEIPPMGKFVWILSLMIPGVPLLLERRGFYEDIFRLNFGRSLGQIGGAFLGAAFIIGFCVIFFKWEPASRTVLLLTAATLTALLILRRYLSGRMARNRLASGGRKSERVLVAGTAKDTSEFIGGLEDEDLLDMEILGEVVLGGENSTEDLIQEVREKAISRVIFLTGHLFFGPVQEAISACEEEGVEAWLPVNFLKTNIAEPTFDSLGRRPVLVFRSAPEASWGLMAKGVLDRIGALLLIIGTSPLWLLAVIGIKLSSKGPVFFKQKRSGRHGEPFQMYKFRTMIPDAEAKQKELAEENEMDGPVFKVTDDPRIFPVGRRLRKWSIDELPQLINVLRGEMSLVGPRPLPTYEIEQIQVAAQRRRLSVKPGITCLWQVSGRNKITSFEEWVELDLEYIDSWSFWLDLKILLRTIPVVIFGSGAS